ncbi:MAG: hypothetical protein AB7S74_09845 [Hyphomicrobium sp.]
MSAAFFDLEFDANDLWGEDGALVGPSLVRARGSGPKIFYRSRTGLLAEEVPFRTDLSLLQAQMVAAHLGLADALVRKNCAQNAILANVLYVHAQCAGNRVFYSRDRNFYAEIDSRYAPPFYTYSRMLEGVAELEAAGLIESIKTSPSPVAKYRSRIRASDMLLGKTAEIGVDFSVSPREVIILKSVTGQLLPYDNSSDEIINRRRDVLEHNAFLESVDIRVVHPEAHYDECGFLSIRDRRLDPRMRKYYRVFNGGWSSGGRWYGPYWQGLPKDIRKALRINGDVIVEHDYRACHVRLLCALGGITLPFDDPGFDPYEGVGYDRKQVKRALNTMLNASSEAAALGAIQNEFADQRIYPPGAHARAIMMAVRDHFTGLARFWCSGIGLRLQNFDAEICRCVQRHLRRRNIPVLSVHDSFIVPSSHGGVLADVMEQEMRSQCQKLSLRK